MYVLEFCDVLSDFFHHNFFVGCVSVSQIFHIFPVTSLLIHIFTFDVCLLFKRPVNIVVIDANIDCLVVVFVAVAQVEPVFAFPNLVIAVNEYNKFIFLFFI